jgi:hypothetical protein
MGFFRSPISNITGLMRKPYETRLQKEVIIPTYKMDETCAADLSQNPIYMVVTKKKMKYHI